VNIGIIGAGNGGGTLGSRWARNGHSVAFGTRDPNSAESRELLQKAGSGTAATMADAAKSSDVLLIFTPWNVTQQVIESLGDLSGKIVIDATNPLLPDLSGLALPNTTSAPEQVAQWASGARVVKAFNTVGFNIMANTSFGANSALLFYCGDDAAAKADREVTRRRARIRSTRRWPATSGAAPGAIRPVVDLTGLWPRLRPRVRISVTTALTLAEPYSTL
jgi:hypothetical protein